MLVYQRVHRNRWVSKYASILNLLVARLIYQPTARFGLGIIGVWKWKQHTTASTQPLPLLYTYCIYIYTYFGEGGRGGSNKYIMPSIDRYWRAQPFSQNTRNLLINIGDQLTFLISNVYEQISRVLLLSRFWYIYMSILTIFAISDSSVLYLWKNGMIVPRQAGRFEAAIGRWGPDFCYQVKLKHNFCCHLVVLRSSQTG